MPTTPHRERESNLMELAKQAIKAIDISSKMPMPAGYIDDLFHETASEDIYRWGPEEIAEIAIRSWNNLCEGRDGNYRVSMEVGHARASEQKAYEQVGLLHVNNEDASFIVSSVAQDITELGITSLLIAHPILLVTRHSDGRLSEYLGLRKNSPEVNLNASEIKVESQILMVLANDLEAVIDNDKVISTVSKTLEHIHAAVSDWPKMLSRLADELARLEDRRETLNEEAQRRDLDETIAFVRWLIEGNFIFLGVAELRLSTKDGTSEIAIDHSKDLGVFRIEKIKILRKLREYFDVTKETLDFLGGSSELLVTKASVKSLVHRKVNYDYIGLKHRDDNGQLIGELRLIGLFAAPAYRDRISNIPLLRQKAEYAFNHMQIERSSHLGNSMSNSIENYPRDDLFQIDPDLFCSQMREILLLRHRPRVRVLVRLDEFDRFVSIISFIPADRYSTDLQQKFGEFLASAFGGIFRLSEPEFPGTGLVRIYYIIGLYDGKANQVSRDSLEFELNYLSRSWTDRLVAAINRKYPADQSRGKCNSYDSAFPGNYQDQVSVERALSDIEILDTMNPQRDQVFLSFDWSREKTSHDSDEKLILELRLFHHKDPIALSERVPILENIGFRVIDESSYEIAAISDQHQMTWLHNMRLEFAADVKENVSEDDLVRLKPIIENNFRAVWMGLAENDRLNQLTLTEGLDWKIIAFFRTIGMYLAQCGQVFTKAILTETLSMHGQATQAMWSIFNQKFQPALQDDATQRDANIAAAHAMLEQELEQVETLAEDKIIRNFSAVINAVQRTNFFQSHTDRRDHLIALKLKPSGLSFVPRPRPYVETYVCGPRLEALHLRFGAVARGGLRWSDLKSGMRGEILGLVKAQNVKNAVIIPVGAKGGFLPRKMPKNPSRDQFMTEGTACYRLFINNLFDLADNLDSAGEIKKPDNCVCLDGDDPYLVVAADKGTASFSDTANEISISRKFWLGDAFASGGSHGYDHKKMAITARGAWESVIRHFLEAKIDIEQAFTVVGVGDMSGDVFGNGMLLSDKIKLIAAFDHRSIFIDPDPDPASSFAERKRLFDLPTSSWEDYNRELISDGGGVYSKTSKQVELSPAARTALGLSNESYSPIEVIRAILKAKVDLLWFGGIGNYIRAVSESSDEINDRANDLVRIASTDVGAKVLGEGANLGVTQRARIELSRRGIGINSDAIDNSAGVNCSDIEVNIKIPLEKAIASGQLNFNDRNALLVSMTSEVAKKALINNYRQNFAISISQLAGVELNDSYQAIFRNLETRDLLNREIEFLPSDAAIADLSSHGLGLTRPEIAVAMAYLKITLYNDLLLSKFHDDPYLLETQLDYFPGQLRNDKKYLPLYERHQLRKEIISTSIANDMINLGGPRLITELDDSAEIDASRAANCFIIARDSFGFRDIFDKTCECSSDQTIVLNALSLIKRTLIEQCSWLYRMLDPELSLTQAITDLQTNRQAIEEIVTTMQPASSNRSAQGYLKRLKNAGIDESLAQDLASLPRIAQAPAIIRISRMTGVDLKTCTIVFFNLADRISMFRLLSEAEGVKIVEDSFERKALVAAVRSLRDSVENAVIRIVSSSESQQDPRKLVAELPIDELEQMTNRIILSKRPSSGKIAMIAGFVEGIKT